MEFFDVKKLMTGAFNPSDKCIPGLLILDQSSFRAFSATGTCLKALVIKSDL